jgi:hypothetical protein
MAMRVTKSNTGENDAMEAEESDHIARAGKVCYKCGDLQEIGAICCSNCGSFDLDDRRARPQRSQAGKLEKLPHPWTQIQVKPGGTIALSGNRGAGKTSSCLALRPRRISTSEQEIDQVRDTWYRLFPDEEAPEIHTCTTWEELEDDVEDLNEGDRWIGDSVSQLGTIHESSKIVERIIKKIRDRKAVGIFILQYNKAGEPFGPNQLTHLVDVVSTIEVESSGLRRLTTTKNRFGPLVTQYFAINHRGHLVEENFDDLYSIEGDAGDYRLHMYPMKGSKWAGIFEELEEAGLLLKKKASAAIVSTMYETGFAIPKDTDGRRHFAEAHGLEWISPEDAREMILEHNAKRLIEEDEPETKSKTKKRRG